MVLTHRQEFTMSHVEQPLCDGEPLVQVSESTAPPPQPPTTEQVLLASLAWQVEELSTIVKELHTPRWQDNS